MKGKPSDVIAPGLEDEPPGFETALQRLEQAVAALESGTLDLDAALATYERGITMLERCQALLDSAEKRVSQIVGTRADGVVVLGDFTPDAPAGLE
jgi:exodeoxyribonuclease VII small subunit